MRSNIPQKDCSMCCQSVQNKLPKAFQALLLPDVCSHLCCKFGVHGHPRNYPTWTRVALDFQYFDNCPQNCFECSFALKKSPQEFCKP